MEDVGQCQYDGEHCVNCCEDNGWICENCGDCAEALGKEICEYCGRCEDCQDSEYHCQECGECYENVNRCHDGGEHCEDCCESNGWICEQCGCCMEANGFDRCEFCGLCSECCIDNAHSLGDSGHCLADPKWKDEYKAKHDAGQHILVREYDANEHWWRCVYPDCTYEEYREKHTPNYQWKALEGGWGEKSGTEKCGCSRCAYDQVLTRKTEGKTAHFTESPVSVWVKNGERYKYEFSLRVEGSDGKKFNWTGGYVMAFELPKGKQWPEDPADVYNGFYAEWPREQWTTPTSGFGFIEGKATSCRDAMNSLCSVSYSSTDLRARTRTIATATNSK